MSMLLFGDSAKRIKWLQRDKYPAASAGHSVLTINKLIRFREETGFVFVMTFQLERFLQNQEKHEDN